MKSLGILLLIIGAIWVLNAFAMNTAVSFPAQSIDDINIPSLIVEKTELMNDRFYHLMASIIVLVFGAILVALAQIQQQLPEGWRRISLVCAYAVSAFVLIFMIFGLFSNGYYTFPPKSYSYNESAKVPFITVNDLESLVNKIYSVNPSLDQTAHSLQPITPFMEIYFKQLNIRRECAAKREMGLFWSAFVVLPFFFYHLILKLFCLIFWIVDGFKHGKE